jgi:hypothetical protein
MTAFIIDKSDINKHPDLREELKLIADKVEEWDSILIYETVPQNFSAFIKLLNAHRISFHLKNS